MTRARRAASIVVLALAIPSLSGAQWLKDKTPGLPRDKDGKPTLDAQRPLAPTASRISLVSGA
jgi:hypothetical protein